MNKALRVVALLMAALLAAPTLVAQKPTAFLPTAFAGWQQASAPQVTANAAEADPVYGDLLREYGLTLFEGTTYTKPGRTMSVKAVLFKDASGAYGAFSFYKTPPMQREDIGDQAASNNLHVMFYRGNVLVEVTLDRVTATSAGELRELADNIPLPNGPDRNPPILPAYLPRQGYVPNTAKYVVGPLALASVGAPVAGNLVDFAHGAEVALGQYSGTGGNATLMLISYPTPQIAAERLRAIEASFAGSPAAATQVLTKRTGPIVVVVSGPMAAPEAKSLLASINYDADVTWNQATKLTKNENVIGLLAGVIILIGVILGFSLVAGVAFGGVRMILKRLFPDRIFDRSEDVEIIQLNLR